MSPRTWLVDEIIPANALVSIHGDQGAGKSTLVEDLAACIAFGNRFLGLAVEQGSVIYDSTDASSRAIQRLNFWSDTHDVTGSGHKVMMFSASESGQVDGMPISAAVNHLRGVLSDHGLSMPSLVVFDGVNPGIGAADMAVLNEFLVGVREKVPVTVILVHRARCSQALRDAIDVEYRFTNHGGAIRMSCLRMRGAPKPEPLTFQLMRAEKLSMEPGDFSHESAVYVVRTSRKPAPDAEVAA
jgi:hypothetical protein